MHEPPGGKARELAAQEAEDFGPVDFKCAGSLSLRQPPRANGFANADGKSGLGKTLLRIAQTDVSEDVAAAFFDRNPIVHDPLAPLGASPQPARIANLLGRCRIGAKRGTFCPNLGCFLSEKHIPQLQIHCNADRHSGSIR